MPRTLTNRARTRPDEGGASAVEFALVVPFLLLIVFGIIVYGMVFAQTLSLSNSARQGALNRVASKHFDFVVCRASDLSAVCAVELNDKSHSSQRAKARDDLIVKVCQAINLPLLTVQAQQAYSLQEVQARFTAAIALPSPPVGT